MKITFFTAVKNRSILHRYVIVISSNCLSFYRPVTPLPAASPYRGPTPLEPVNLQLPEEIRKSITGTKTEARGEILSTELSLNI